MWLKSFIMFMSCMPLCKTVFILSEMQICVTLWCATFRINGSLNIKFFVTNFTVSFFSSVNWYFPPSNTFTQQIILCQQLVWLVDTIHMCVVPLYTLRLKNSHFTIFVIDLGLGLPFYLHKTVSPINGWNHGHNLIVFPLQTESFSFATLSHVTTFLAICPNFPFFYWLRKSFSNFNCCSTRLCACIKQISDQLSWCIEIVEIKMIPLIFVWIN